jgi:hypothetical protein
MTTTSLHTTSRAAQGAPWALGREEYWLLTSAFDFPSPYTAKVGEVFKVNDMKVDLNAGPG